MADTFVSYTESDRDWAFWLGHELEDLGHAPHIHAWEISGGGDIAAWMEERHDKADRILCVVSKAYLGKPYSSWERRSAQWAAAGDRPGFVLPVFVESCEVPTLFAHLKRCELYGLSEEEARARLKQFMTPAGKPTQRTAFPGGAKTAPEQASVRPPPKFPGTAALSNIPIIVPRHFVGRDDALKAITTALASTEGRAAITTLHGMRGVGKTTLAAAYAERHRGDYRATWWIRAQTEPTIRADLVALGVRLGWVAADEKEEPALAAVTDMLRHDGEGILLIFDNALVADSVKPYLPRGGRSKILVTSNAYAWRGRSAGRNSRLVQGGWRRLPHCPNRARGGARSGLSSIGGARRPTARPRTGGRLLRAAGSLSCCVPRAFRGRASAITRRCARCAGRA